ncbi:MAG: hypothetical protein EPO07_11405 [Verrucomicrobia bacterium]|nr:MAG: hypothetical protein EPO07_11405 [Verrucomicrobiota bacterium]
MNLNTSQPGKIASKVSRLRHNPGTVARRRRNREQDIALGVVQLVALAGLLVIFIPQVRQVLFSLGAILPGALVVVVVVAVGVFLIRSSKRKSVVDRAQEISPKQPTAPQIKCEPSISVFIELSDNSFTDELPDWIYGACGTQPLNQVERSRTAAAWAAVN